MYGNDADLYDRIDQETVIQLTDDENTGEVDQTKLDNLRGDVAEMINTYLRGRYTVPVDPVPAVLANIENDLLVHKLYTRRANYDIPKSVAELKKDALKLLDGINKGAVLLEDQPDIAEGAIQSNKTDDDRIFPDSKLDYF